MGSEGEMVTGMRPLSINITEISRQLAEEEPLSPVARLMHEPQFNCCIVAVMGTGKRIDVGIIKAGLESTLVHHPRFSSILVCDEPGGVRPRWVRTTVDLDHHVVVPDLDPAATATATATATASPDKLLEDYIASLSTAAPLDPSRPLWELHLLDLRTSDSEGVLVFRIHHSLGDGVSLISLLLACARKSSHPDSLPSLPATRRPPPPRSLLRHARDMIMVAWHTLVSVLLLIATVLFLRDTKTSLKALNGSRFRRPMRLLHCTISLDDVKSVKNALHCTINDVLIGVTSAGLSRYLSRNYSSSSGLPESIRFRATLISNTRPSPGIHTLSEMMERGNGSGNARWGNALSFVLLPIPIGMCQDPLDYVRKGKEIADRKKNSLEASFCHSIASLCLRMFNIKAVSALCHRVFHQTTVTFSNVVGPVEEILFYGHPVLYLAPGVFGLPHALTIHFQSYMNKMEIVLSVDEMVAPDPEQLLDDLAVSLKLIKGAILA